MVKIVVICLDLQSEKYLTLPCDEITVDPSTTPGTPPSVTVYFDGEITGYFAHPVYAHVQEVEDDEFEDEDDDEDEDADLDGETGDDSGDDSGDDDNGGGGGGGDSGDGGPEPLVPSGANVPYYDIPTVELVSGSDNGSLEALESALSR